MSNIINPVAERALDMALRHHGKDIHDYLTVVTTAKTFEKYLNQNRPSLDDFEEVLKAARLVAEEISLKALPSGNEETLLKAVRKVFDQT